MSEISMISSPGHSTTPWRRCILCQDLGFKSPQEFRSHIRSAHCKKEGGSYVCCYGLNNVCSSLPLEGVSEKDYEFHVARHHVLAISDDEKKLHEDEFMENLCQKYQHILTASPTNQQPNVVEDQYKWTVYDSTQNLPALLNDPRRSKREGDLFTKTWGDKFVEYAAVPPCPYIPEISPAHFDGYLKHAKKRMQQHSRKALSRRWSDVKSQSKFGQSLLLKSAADDSTNELEDVPKIFMQADFSLENPEVFNEVLPWSQLYGHLSTDKSTPPKNSVKLLQEKMSHYLDVVEVQIARQISLRSEAFFHAMTSHDALMDQLTHVIGSVCALRERINKIEEVIVKTPMQVLRLKMRQGNYMQVYNKLKLMSTVHQTQPTIQLLLSTSEFVGALDLIYTTQDVLVQELAGVHSFRYLSSQLSEMEKVIGKMMQTDFVRYVTADLNRPPTEENVMEEDRLIAILFGMLRQKNYSFVQAFKDECCTAIEAAVKQSVIAVISEAEDVEVESNTGNFTEHLRPLNLMKWLDAFQLVLKNLSFLLRRIQAMYRVMEETTQVAAGFHSRSSGADNSCQSRSLQLLDGESDVMISEQAYTNLMSDLKDLMCSVCERADACCSKVFSVKSKDGSLDKLSTSDFMILVKSVDDFREKCESICGKQSSSMRFALQSQALRFCSKFHEERKVKLNLLLENEQWKQADVPMEFQELVDHIVSTGMVTGLKKLHEQQGLGRKPQPYMVIENEKYAVVGTVLMLLKMMSEYCQCAEELPLVASDFAARLVDLLKVFNSRTCQLVLGAGALQLVGLKTITTKHLALASRCLKLVMYFLPKVKAHFSSKATTKAALKHFDQVLKDYNDHVTEITNKMESIISEMFDTQLRQWVVKAPVPSPCFRAISKQLNKFHELLHGLLPPDEIEGIFLRVNKVFKEKLQYHLTRLQVSTDGGPQHGLVTQELTFYTQNLKNLNLKSDFSMNDLWRPR